MINPKFRIFLLTLFTFSIFLSFAQKNASENSAVFIMNGINAHDDEMYQSAVKNYDKVHRNDTNYPLALYEKSLSLLAAEKYEECIEACKAGLKLPPTANEAYFYITYGSALSDLEQYDESIKIFSEGIALYPHNSTLRFNLALVQLRADNYDDALSTLYATLEDNPFHGRSHLLLGEIAKHKGYPTKAILANTMFILMEDNNATGYSILQGLDTYCNSKMDEGGDYEDTELDNEGFEEVDELIFNKVAINKKYKTPSNFTFPYVKQLHLISTSLKDITADEDDFWVKFYIPFFKKIMRDDEFAGYASYLLRSGQGYNTAIAKGLEKSSRARSSFISWFQNNFSDMYAMKGEGSDKTQYHYNAGYLVAIGELSSSGKERLGDWVFYNSTGSKSAEGSYEDNEKTGKWKYYNTGGRLESWYEMEDGAANGPFEEYNLNGITIKKGEYKDGLFTGMLKTYYETGGIEGERELKEGKLDGTLKYYHKNGELSVSTQCTDGELNGLLTRYTALGTKQSEIEYKDDEKNGYSKVWYSDGQLESNYTYKNGELNGSCKSYYRNGQLKQEETYTEGMLTGNSTSYFEDGTKQESSDFDEDGKENGVFTEYFPSGEVYSELTYKKGDLSSYVFYDKAGNIVSEGKKKGKKLNYIRIDSNGYKNLEGYFIKGERSGPWKVTGPRGVLYSELNYKDGELNGPQKRYYSNGTLSKEYSCEDGDIEGLYKMYSYGNPGSIYYEGVLNDDVKQGRFLEYNKMGILVDEEYYVDGEQDGWQAYHTQKGVLARESLTKDGYFLGIITYDSSGNNGERHFLENGSGELRLNYPNGNKKFIGNYQNGNSQGTFTWFYPDGSIDTKGEYINDVRHGKWVSYHKNGKVSLERNYNLGELQGKYTAYFEDGSVSKEITYLEGYIHGTYKRYFYNGKPREVSQYMNGDMHGERISYVPTGEVAIIRYYIDDVLVSYSSPSADGKATEVIDLTEGKQTITAKYPNGTTSVKFTIEKDKLLDEFTWYYPNGDVYRTSAYKDGALDGDLVAYYPDGKKLYVYPHKYGEFHGVCTDYYPSGKPKQALRYFCGEKEGKSLYYDTNGNVKETIYYFDDAVYATKP